MNVGHGGTGVVTHNGGSLVVGGWVDLARNPGSTGTYLMSGGSLSAGEVSLGNSGQATFTLNGGEVRTGSLGLGTGAGYTNGGTGTFALEGGTLGVNNINVTSGTFTWGDATLTTRQEAQNANNGVTDFSSAGFGEVKLGTSISINQNLVTAASTLDLNGFYINGGIRFDQLAVTGSLDLSAAGDALDMTINPYLLRPNIGSAVDSGEIPLVTASLGITDEFDTGPTFLQDNIGWSEYTGAWVVGSSTAAATLGVNEYYLEYDSAGSITLFYKVEGTVPEPGTMGLLAVGLLFARGMRERRRRSA